MAGVARDPKCPFCAIAGGDDSDVEVIARGQGWLAFFPLEPATLGHTLLIPTAHVPDLWQLPETYAPALLGACVQVGQDLQRALAPDGMNLISSAGEAAEQSVFHLHLHLVPRYPRDSLGPIWPTCAPKVEPSKLTELAIRLRDPR